MNIYSIISATNRPDNRTLSFAGLCQYILSEKGADARIFSLLDIPDTFSLHKMYEFDDSPLTPIVEKFILPANKFIFIVPEYNGSYPGVLKLFIDSVHPQFFHGKKALLIGASTGRAGNLRGMDHLTGVLHYLKVEVYSQKLPISSIHRIVDESGVIKDEETIKLIDKYIADFIKF